MKKTLLFVACIFAFVSFSYAQTPTISWGANLDKDIDLIEIVGETEDGIFAISDDGDEYGHKYVLHTYDPKSMASIHKGRLVLQKIDGEKPSLDSYLVWGGKFYVIVSTRSSQVFTKYAIEIDVKGVISKSPLKLIEKPILPNAKFTKFSINTIGTYAVSEDKTRILFYIWDTAKKEEEDVDGRLNGYVFDEELKLIHTAKTQVNKSPTGEETRLIDMVTDNNGSIYYLFTQLQENGGSLISYEVAHVDIDGETYRYSVNPYDIVKKFPGQEMSVTVSAFRVNAKGDLCMTGYFSGKDPKKPAFPSSIKGFFFVGADSEQHKIKDIEITLLSEETGLEATGGDKEYFDTYGLMSFYKTRKVINRKDGALIVFCENADNIIRGTVLVICYGTNGKVEWIRAVAKTQYGADLNIAKYHSFTLLNDDSKIYLVFNDNSLGKYASSGKEMRKIANEDMSKTTLVAVELGLDGKGGEKTKLEDNATGRVYTQPFVSNQNNNAEVLIFGSNKKEKKLGRIKL